MISDLETHILDDVEAGQPGGGGQPVHQDEEDVLPRHRARHLHQPWSGCVLLPPLPRYTHLAYPAGGALPALLLPQGGPHHAGDPLLQPLLVTRPRPASPPPPLRVVQPRIPGLLKVSLIFTIFGEEL